MDLKTTKGIISERRKNGANDQQIYDQLSAQYPNRKNLALLITGTVTDESKTKYKSLNNILLYLLLALVLIRIVSSFSLLLAGEFTTFLISLIGLLLPAIFVYGVYNCMAAVYRLCGILSILGVVQILASILTQSIEGAEGNHSLTAFLSVALLGAIATLSFYLSSKMFPNFKPGKLKKDSKGEYILA